MPLSVKAIFFIILTLGIPGAVINAAGLKHITVKDGLLNTTVYYAMQDSKGFIWFCTETGINRFDGKTFESFTIKDGLADNENFKCYEDSKGRIWFLSYNGNLSYYFDGKIYNSDNRPSLFYASSGSFLLDCLEDKWGSIWVSTSTGELLQITDKGVNIIASLFPEKQHNRFYLNSTLFKENDSVKKMVINFQQPVSIYKLSLPGKQLSFLTTFADLLKQKDTFIKDHRMLNLFCTDSFLIQYDKYGKLSRVKIDDLNIGSRILCVFNDQDNWWFGTAGDGAYCVGKNTPGNPSRTFNVLPGEVVTSILKDNEGNYWFTTYNNGVFILKKNGLFIKTIQTGVTYSIGIVKSKNKRIIISGGKKNDLNIIENDTITRTLRISDKKFSRVQGIIVLSDTNIIIGTDDPMLYRYNLLTNRLLLINNMEGYKSSYVVDADNIWICQQGVILKIKKNGAWDVIAHTSSEKYTSIAVVSNSLYYLGTKNKLYKVINNKPKVLLDNSILKVAITDMKFIDGNLWVATHGNGIFILGNDTVSRHLAVQNENLVSDVCKQLYVDQSEYVWVATDHGISVVKKKDATVFYNITSSQGLISNDIKNIASDSGYIYIATTEGINLFRLEDIMQVSVPPKVYVTGFKKGNEAMIVPGKQLVFDYFNGFIDIFFTAITYESPLDIQYQYKLENDPDWHNSKYADISFFKLLPGTHKLLIRAKKYNSAWSTPTTFLMVVRPLWYQSYWFYFFLSVILVLLIYTIQNKRIKIIHKRIDEKNKLYKRMIELESKALAYQMNPHFIFNSLSTVQQFILEKEEEQGLNYLSDFSLLIRQILEHSKKPFIFLTEEIDFLNRYLQLERIRSDNKFDYTITVENDIAQNEIKIPPVIFQPLLENAVKYGVSSIDAKGNISLHFKKQDNFLTGIVEDNGTGIFSKKKNTYRPGKKESSAIRIIEERLRLMPDSKGIYGTINIIDKSTNETDRSRGTIVEVRIPII